MGREYAAGRYVGDPPVPFVRDIIASATRAGALHRPGVDIGCGNGRNYVALVNGGLDLIGLDVSEAAVRRLAARAPDRASRLIHGDITRLPSGAPYGVVVGLQVFQHGDRAACHAHVVAAQELLAPGGVMTVRVNAVGTDIEFDHEVVEEEEGKRAHGALRAGSEAGSARAILRPPRVGGAVRRSVRHGPARAM